MVLPIDNPTKSFWIEAAESPLRNFRSTSELPEEADVVIIGSGYTGATCAYWLDKVCALRMDHAARVLTGTSSQRVPNQKWSCSKREVYVRGQRVAMVCVYSFL